MNNETLKSIFTEQIDLSFRLNGFNLHLNVLEREFVTKDEVVMPIEKPVHLGDIKMSPETAKGLLILLQSNIEAYENIYGEIPKFTKDSQQKLDALNQQAFEIKKKIQEENKEKDK